MSPALLASVLGHMLVAVAQPHVASTPTRAPRADSITERLNRELTPWLDAQSKVGKFSGVVLVARRGVPIYTAVYGMADRAHGVPNALDARFQLGSMNKMWTAVAIAQLVDAGKVSLDAAVGQYLPDFPNAAVREHVRIRHLLSHTSGLGTYFQNGFLRNMTYAVKPADIIPFFASDSLSFEPGARMQYSNAGFAVLGMIIERVSGMSFYDYMSRNVLTPAGMTHAAYLDVREHPSDVAVGYARPPGASEDEENWKYIEQHSSPAGGAYASAQDIVAFSQAWFGGKLAAPATVARFTTGVVDMGPTMRYAFGFGVTSFNGWRSVGHNGGIPGGNTEFMAFPDQGIDVVILANMDAPAATDVLRKAVPLITGGR